jgi:DNA-binding beta-propeller fold protein YncE
MKSKTYLKKAMIAVTVSVLFFAFTALSFASDVTTSPILMPGFPMLAGDNVMIMWVPVPGAVKYKIYQNGKPIGEAPVPPFTIPAPTVPGVYKYHITGVDPAGSEGPASKTANISIIVLLQPSDFNYTFMGDTLNLGWGTVANAVIYDLYRADTADGEFKLITSTTTTRFVDPDVSKKESGGKSFFYKIISKDKFNKTSPDTEVHEVKIEVYVERVELKDLTLKIQRTKEQFYAMPMGGGTELKSVLDARFFNDKSALVVINSYKKDIILLDKYGDGIGTIVENGPKPDQIGVPFKFALDKDDNVYVTDAGSNPRIFAFTRDGTLIYMAKGHLVTEDDAKGKYDPPKDYKKLGLTAIALSGENLYVADKMSGTIQIYDKETGEFKDYLRNKETGKIPIFGVPALLNISPDGKKLYIGRSLERVVNVVDLDTGERLYDIGKSKSFIGAFMSVSGICFDKDSNVVVTDAVMSAVQVFSNETGEYMYHIGDEKAIPDARSADQRPVVMKLSSPFSPTFDDKGRLWIFTKHGGFTVRAYVGDKIWDVTVDEPEGKSPQPK